MLAVAPIGAVPLRRLHLDFGYRLPFLDVGHVRRAASVLARHRRSLEDLQMDGLDADSLDERTAQRWSAADLLSSIGGLPVLKTLTLTGSMTTEVAAAVAAACPALETFNLPWAPVK